MPTGIAAPGGFDLEPCAFHALPGWGEDELVSFWPAFIASCRAVASEAPELRKGTAPGADQRAACRKALALGPDAAAADVRGFLERNFRPFLISPHRGEPQTFFTAYYRPELRASLEPTPEFREPLLARPDDLVALEPGEANPALAGLSAAQRTPDGRLRPYPTRAQIDAGGLGRNARPVAYVADAIEAFMIHVQGSARLVLDDGRRLDLTYAGRNGHPYTSIGKALIARGEIKLEDMSLERLKAWVRQSGQEMDQPGRALLQMNRSFIFFSASPADRESSGPVGAAGLPLTPFRSIAIDRSVWPYGLPYWVEATIPWRSQDATPFRRLVVGQDTGSAIVGPSRADLFFGDGPEAGRLAGAVRHHGAIYVLLPGDVSR